jgi:preprotein translocase subunit SecA
MRIFGGEQITKVMDFLKIDENQPIENGMIGKAIESAQVKVEGFFFDQRKQLVEFDDVMNKQREIIYKRRRRLLEQSSLPESGGNSTNDADESAESELTLRQDILRMIDEEIESIVSLNAPAKFEPEEYEQIAKEYSRIIPFDTSSQRSLAKKLEKDGTAEAVADSLKSVAHDAYVSRIKQMGEGQMARLERLVVLSSFDSKWMDHLDSMDSLREGIWLRGDKQTVLSEYKKEGFAMFETLIQTIETSVVEQMFRVQLMDTAQLPTMPENMVEQKADINEPLTKEVADATPPGEVVPGSTKGSIGDLAAAMRNAKASARPEPGNKHEKIGRNDPCPCGSGLKYKKCGLINAPQHRN